MTENDPKKPLQDAIRAAIDTMENVRDNFFDEGDGPYDDLTAAARDLELVVNVDLEVPSLVDEYQDIATEYGDLCLLEEGQEDVAKTLERDHDWTPEGAKQLVELATKYGAFVLRNALALAIALKIEDGD